MELRTPNIRRLLQEVSVVTFASIFAIAGVGYSVLGRTIPVSADGVPPLSRPQGVAVDSSGNVYIDNFNKSTIEKLTPSGVLSVIAGTGSAGAPTPGPATSSALNFPIGVAVDSSGNVYIADFVNSDVEKVNTSGILSIVAGTGSSGTPTPGLATSSPLCAPLGVAIDSSGNVYIADQGIQGGANNVIEKVDTSGNLSIFAGEVASSGAPTPGPATSSKLDYPQSVGVDSSGNVYTTSDNVVEKVDTSGNLSIFAGELGAGTGTPTPGPATSSKFNLPIATAADSAGNIYIADNGNNMIEKVDTSGILSIYAGTGTIGAPTPGPATSSDLNSPVGVGTDRSGNVYIADTRNNMIEKVNTSGTLSIIAGGAPNAPADLDSSRITANSTTLTWTPSTDTEGGTVAGYYLYDYVTSSGPGSATLYANIANPSANSENVTGLNPATSYTFYVEAYDAAGTPNVSPPSTTVIVKTKVLITSPTRITSSNTNSNSTFLSWTPAVDNGGGTVAGYDLYMYITSAGRGSAVLYSVLPPTNAASIVGLSPNTTYSFYFKTFDSSTPVNYSGDSATIKVTTTN